MPEPDGLTLQDVDELFSKIRERTTVVGMGLTGLAPREESIEPLTSLCRGLGF
jgi:hypothetical protein